MELKRAKIGVLTGTNTTEGDTDVQFNPATLRLQITNSIEGGQQTGRQVRQFLGSSSSTLTCDLIFDTADDGTTDAPVSVRTRTSILERFLEPTEEGGRKYVTPRIRFQWGDLTFDGVVDNLSIDFDHFAADGIPLRAKVSVSIKEQDPALELNQRGPGANGGPPPGKPGAASVAGLGGGLSLGVSAGLGLSLGASANVGVALGGESAADFAVRAGLDPAAWRGLDLGGESSLSLSAGLQVGFDTSLTASGGLGVTIGVEAGATASVEAAFGLRVDTKFGAVGGVGISGELTAGFALASAGGVGAALEAVQTAKNDAAERQARLAFQVPEPRSPLAIAAVGRAEVTAVRGPEPRPRPPMQDRAPMRVAGPPLTPASAPTAASAPRLPKADERASTFGFGVPLRPRAGKAALQRAETLGGGPILRPKIQAALPPTTADPTRPGWRALPADPTGRSSPRPKLKKKPDCGCRC